MIQIKYKLLYEIEILHGFYRTGRCPDFTLVPTQACKSLLNSFGLRFLPNKFGGQVYAKVNMDETIKSPLTDGSHFSFLMVLNNPNFDNFSVLNTLKPKGSHYYFNNYTSNLSLDSSPLLVANSTTKVVSDSDLMPFVLHSFSYKHENTAGVQDSSLLFTDSGEEFDQSLNNHNNIFNFSYNLMKSNGGRARLIVEEVEKAAMYVLSPNDLQDIFGMIEIFYKASLPTEYQFQNNNLTLSSKSYKISFANTATRWRYIISKKYNKALTTVIVGKTNGNPIPFTAVPNPPADQFILASNQPVSLQEDPVTGIQLRDQADKVLIANLPNPPLMLVKTEGSETFSDILITI
ncbi:hypothetical protein [Algoriphagus antarcticus]|uniref:Uncharacterized protein n=1 Tax=Algoriphagus antarcticus TaxID=238540 RepID=A0A3E0DRH0_9BACT|nr:hypothetical protein [Algoriphagus antarcticus]REG84015.1 hypothetical protein C8N25_11670 [Algoriphagus antarcticus]